MKKHCVLIAVLFVLGLKVQSQPTFNLAEFNKLRWLEGKWEGAAAGEQPFYEEYKFLNDSTLAMLYFKDATFSGTPDTGWVYLQGNSIIHRSGNARWKLTSLNESELLFAPVNVKRGFVWRKENNNQWNAVLELEDKEGKVITKTYTLKRKD